MNKINLQIDKSNWTLIRLGDIAYEINERIDSPNQSVFDRFVGLEHFVCGDLKIKNWKSTKDLVSAAKKFKSGDILFARRNAYLKRASMVEFDGLCSGDAFVLREDHKKIIPGFLAFIVNSNSLWEYANSNAAGTMSKRVKWRDLANYEFLLPPKDHQAKIAELLWAMDEVIEREVHLLKQIHTIFLSYSKSIFSISSGDEKELKELGKLIMGQSPPGNTYNENGEGMAFLQGNAEFGEKHPYHVKYTNAPKKIVQKHTILISVRAPVGDLNIANKEYCIGRGLAGLFINDKTLRDYVYNFLKFAKIELEKNSTGSTFKAINKDILSTLKLFIPSDQILKDNSDKLNSIISSREKISKKINDSQALHKSLINQMF